MGAKEVRVNSREYPSIVILVNPELDISRLKHYSFNLIIQLFNQISIGRLLKYLQWPIYY
jgi:hypothetical protein